jgi:hypothetical protein
MNANPSEQRRSVSPDYLSRTNYAAYEAFSEGGDLTEMLEDTDLELFVYRGEYYTESHDEQHCHVFRNGELIQVDWDSRPR